MDKLIKDINDLRVKLRKVLNVIEDDVESSMDGWREHASYSLSSVRLIDYYHNNVFYFENINGKTFLFYGVNETKMDIKIGGSESMEGMEITYYPSDNIHHIPFMREMLIMDVFYNSRDQKQAVSEYVDNLNGLKQKIDKFKSILESFGARDPIEINLLNAIPNLDKEILNNLVTYAFDEKIENKLLSQEEMNTLNSLCPIEFEINLNFYTSEFKKHHQFVSDLFRTFLFGIDIEKYIEKLVIKQSDMRDFCLASINKENKEKVKRKI